MKMRSILLCGCFIFVVSFSACSTGRMNIESKSEAEYAREIIEITDVSNILDQVMFQMKQMQGQLIDQMGIPANEKEKVMEFQNKFNDLIAELFSYEKLEPEFLDIFTSVYTIEELKALSKFYKSPAGQSMLKKQPLILEKSMQIAQGQINELFPRIQKLVEEMGME